MKKMLLCLLVVLNLYGEDGLVIPVCDKYMEFFYPSLAWLRLTLKSTLPIEVWYSGDELSDKAKKKISFFEGVTFRDIAEVRGGDPKEYRGYQIKPLALQASRFDRAILIDADVFMYLDPRELFNLPGFIETGAFFFRDTNIKEYTGLERKNKKYPTHSEFCLRRDFYLKHIKEPSSYLPPDWRFYWEGQEPSLSHPLPAELMESGVVVLDKNRHQQGLSEIVELNLNWREVYTFILGDKETFWMGLEKAFEPYTVNDKLPYKFYGGIKVRQNSSHKVDLVHYIDDQMIFQQKAPISIGYHPFFCIGSNKEARFVVPDKDLKLLNYARSFYLRYSY